VIPIPAREIVADKRRLAFFQPDNLVGQGLELGDRDADFLQILHGPIGFIGAIQVVDPGNVGIMAITHVRHAHRAGGALVAGRFRLGLIQERL